MGELLGGDQYFPCARVMAFPTLLPNDIKKEKEKKKKEVARG